MKFILQEIELEVVKAYYGIMLMNTQTYACKLMSYNSIPCSHAWPRYCEMSIAYCKHKQ